MNYTPRGYQEIVRDLLTTLTGGTIGESLTVPGGDGPLTQPLDPLRDRPVKRVSHLEGFVAVGSGENARTVPYRFTPADFELVATGGDGLNAIRFRDGGRRPAPGTTLTVNYYPVAAEQVPLTDLNVGSVVRTLLETVARELALSYFHLEHIYKSAFLETAEGGSLDKVVALVGLRRLPAGHPVVKVRFARRPGTAGRITIPVGTPLVDGAGQRYLLLEELTLEPNEPSREGLAGGESEGTEPVAAGALNRLEIDVAGLERPTNPEPARRLSAAETDAELRRRAAGALHGRTLGTVDALRFGLLSLEGVNEVTIVEAPNGVPGEIEVQVASDGRPKLEEQVARTIDELRPAGIRVVQREASRRPINVRVALTLAGSGVSSAELAALTAAVEGRLVDHLKRIPPGGQVRRSRLAALVLEDARIADAEVTLLPEGGGESAELTLGPGEVLDVVQPFAFPPPATEAPAGARPAGVATVSAQLPVHLLPGVTLAQATQAINLAFGSHLTGRRPDAPLTLDGLAAAIRDDSRFALVRSEALLTVESDGRFLQLTDGVGSYAPAANETVQAGTIDVQPREGGV